VDSSEYRTVSSTRDSLASYFSTSGPTISQTYPRVELVQYAPRIRDNQLSYTLYIYLISRYLFSTKYIFFSKKQKNIYTSCIINSRKQSKLYKNKNFFNYLHLGLGRVDKLFPLFVPSPRCCTPSEKSDEWSPLSLKDNHFLAHQLDINSPTPTGFNNNVGSTL
jgi:hypothetical protein